MKPAGAPGPPSACRTLVPSLTEHGHAAQCRGRAAAPTCTRGRRGVHSLPRPPRPPAPAAVLPLASGGAGGRMARRPSRPGDGRPRRVLGQGPRHGEARAARRGGAATLTGGRRVVVGLTDRSASLAPVSFRQLGARSRLRAARYSDRTRTSPCHHTAGTAAVIRSRWCLAPLLSATAGAPIFRSEHEPHDRTCMPRAKTPAIRKPSPYERAGSAQLNAMVERVAPAILGLLAAGGPRPKPAIVAALTGRHERQDVVHALIRLAGTGRGGEAGGRNARGAGEEGRAGEERGGLTRGQANHRQARPAVAISQAATTSPQPRTSARSTSSMPP